MVRKKNNIDIEGLVRYVCPECGRFSYAVESALFYCGFCVQQDPETIPKTKPMQSYWDNEFEFLSSPELAQSTLGKLGH